MSEGTKTLSPIDQKPPFHTMLILALQHVFVMVAGAVVVPISIASEAGIDATFLISCTLFAAGIATIIQCLGIGNFSGAKLAIVEGTSFAALAATRSIVSGNGVEGLRMAAGAVIIGGLFVVLISGVWSKLLVLFPDVVTGTVVTVIGLSLYPIGIRWIMNFNPHPETGGVHGEYLMLAGITLLIILLANKFLKGLLGNLSVLIGIAGGTIVAIIHDNLKAAAISAGEVVSMLNPVRIQQLKEAQWFGFVLPFNYDGQFQTPIFSASAIIPMLLIMVVIMTQATGSMMAIANISGTKMDEKQLSRGIRSNGISTAIAGAFNSYPVTAFAQNIGMLSLTECVSRFVTTAAGVILFVLAFFPKFAAAFAAIPQPVLGGAGFAMFGVVIVGGIRTLGKVNYDGNKNNIIVAVSIGLSLIPTVVPDFFKSMPVGIQGLFGDITLGCVSAILLNLLFNVILVPKNKK